MSAYYSPKKVSSKYAETLTGQQNIDINLMLSDSLRGDLPGHRDDMYWVDGMGTV